MASNKKQKKKKKQIKKDLNSDDEMKEVNFMGSEA
jgi:hypothetical protein